MDLAKKGPFFGSRADIGISHTEYTEIVECLRDAKLSDEAQLRFKNMHVAEDLGSITLMGFCGVISYGINKLFWGPLHMPK